LTIRPFEKWIDSRRRHVERNIAAKRAGKYDRTFLVVDVEKWTIEWDTHMERAHNFFRGRDVFLEVDFIKTPSGPLCGLLGVPEPTSHSPGRTAIGPSTRPTLRLAR